MNPRESRRRPLTEAERIERVIRRSVKGAVRIKSMEGHGPYGPDARVLAAEACRRALEVVSK